jgi:hypothetical protein
MNWIDLVFQGVATIVRQWTEGDAATRREIEARALQATRDMLADKGATASSHDARTAETIAEIDRMRAK